MNKLQHTVSKKRKIERRIILLYCILAAIGVFSVLRFAYTPNYNSLGALGSVCMDVICIIVLVILSLSIAYDQDRITRTTKLFLCLMLATIWALFFDFLNWAFDGSLTFGGWTYVFTVASLCMGSVLGFIFVIYLSSYMHEMYGMVFADFGVKICLLCNVVSYIITIVLAVTHKAFSYVDGHYETGAMYDVITVLPVLTLIYMTVFAILHIKKIGLHDVLAVAGYIFIMICGALIEASYSIGTTYVAVSIADVYIYIMLQNKLLGRVKRQKELLAEKISSQYEILESMAGIYSYVNYVDFEEKTIRRFDIKDSNSEKVDIEKEPHSKLNRQLYEGIEDELKEKFLKYTDLSTLSQRMGKEKIISSEFFHTKEGWFRAIYIRIGDSDDGPVEKVIYAIRNIDEEKKNVEKWIRKSNTDELTGVFNRHAYEDEIASLQKDAPKKNLVYVSIDVNSLKVANDMLGHDAGDELIVGASQCLKQCFGAYGKLFRTGGDEFVALIYADDAQLEAIKRDVEEVSEKWHGKLNSNLTMSIGYVKQSEAQDMSLHQMAVMADKRMYEDKTKYYQKKGLDRRGQRDAHVALCELYTKILKVNISEDSYQIVNMNSEEQTPEFGFSESISKWLHDFATSGQVHTEDLEEYLAKTSLDYISTFFKEGNSILRIFYRRKDHEKFRKVMLEMIPTGEYKDESQNLFLYVKNID